MIHIENIKKKYKKTILNGINLDIQKGKCVGILGRNGCGKTTLLEIMAGMIKPDDGKIFYFNEFIDNRKKFEKYIGFVPQKNPLIEEVSAKDNIFLWHGNSFDKSILEKLGIDEFLNKRVCELSEGMKRRLSIAIALIKNPPIIILDEPGTALDIYGKNEVIAFVKNFVNDGGTAIISTHDSSEIKLCNEIYFIEKGILIKKSLGDELNV